MCRSSNLDRPNSTLPSELLFFLKAAPEKRVVCDQKPWKEPEQRHSVPVWGQARHTSRQSCDMNLRCNSEKKRLEEDNGLISQKLTVRPAWTVNNLIITDLMPLGLTEIEKATLGWGAVNQLCAPCWIISTPVHTEATSDDRYKFKWQLKGTLRHTHIWLTSPTKWFKNVTLFSMCLSDFYRPLNLWGLFVLSFFFASGSSSSGEIQIGCRRFPHLACSFDPKHEGSCWCVRVKPLFQVVLAVWEQ